MNTKFKVGDVVTCVNGDGWEHSEVSYGYVYTLVEDPAQGEDGKLCVDYANDWFGDFELVEKKEIKSEYSLKHYDNFYHLTEQDIKEGKIRVDAYWVAKQWRTGSRDDSGALWHSLKTIARFGEKNSVEREIKALYNQAIALARIYGVDLE